MFGSLLSTLVDVVNIPVRAVNTGVDVISGGSGGQRSRKELPLSGDLESALDEISEDLKDLDR